MLLKVNEAILCHCTDLNEGVLGHFPSLNGIDVTFILFPLDVILIFSLRSLLFSPNLIYVYVIVFFNRKNHSITFKNANRNVGQFLQS